MDSDRRPEIAADTSSTARKVLLDTADVPVRERRALVGDVLGGGVVPLEVEHLDRQSRSIDFQLLSADLGPVNLQSVRSSATAFTRPSRLVSDGSPPTVAVSVHRAGSVTVAQEGREAVLDAGDLALVASAQPSAVRSTRRSSTDVLRIPAELLAVPEAVVRQVTARRLGPELPLAGVLARFVEDLATMPDLRPAEAAHLARPTIELIRALVAVVVGDPVRARESLDATLPVRVVDYLRAHWHERDLTAERIAAAHHISTRHLYRLLAAQGISLRQWVRARRLEACRDELAMPGPAAPTVASVGRRWGFSDATNFGRAFKATYGLTPLEWSLLHRRTSA